MYSVGLSSILRILANGLNPDTGHPLPESLCVHSKTYKNYLNRLAGELENLDSPPPQKKHPKRWTEEEQEQLSREWKEQKLGIEEIAEIHSRSELAIAIRIVKSGIDQEEDVIPHLAKNDQLVAEASLRAET
jgi:transposase